MAALRILGSLLAQEEVQGLTAAEEEAVLAMILLLIFHDVREPRPASLCAPLPRFRTFAETDRLDLRDGSIDPRNPLERGHVPVRQDCVWLEPVRQIRLDSVLLGRPGLVSIATTPLDCQAMQLTENRLDVAG